MANKILTMNKLKKMLRLLIEGKSKRSIGRILNASRKTVDKYQMMLDQHPLSYRQLLDLSYK